MLRNIGQKEVGQLSEEELRIKKLLGERSKSEYSRLARRLRFQYGLRDRYYQGLIRSYRYMDYIESVFAGKNMPDELKFLPHVESSFNYLAYSKVGAAGIWQFMRSTARLYKLKVGYVVDERRDVIKATQAAASLLRDNYRILESWPLALTAYNHGAQSIKRAIRKLGTREIHKIIEGYQGRRFGFASKNFYATFMATVLISKNPEQYFKSFKKPKPLSYSKIILPKPITVKELSSALKVPKKTIKDYNPSIRASAFRSPLFLPKGFVFYFPKSEEKRISRYEKKLESIENKLANATTERLHIVSRGESLYDISKGYKVPLNDLIAFNNIVNPSRIFAGMKLKIPGKDTKIEKVTPKLAVTKVEKAKKVPEPKTPVIAADKNKGLPYGPLLSEIKGERQPNLEGYNLELTRSKGNLYRITIETEETLGHLAEWAGIRTQKIRDWNRLAFGGVINQGQRLVLYLNEEQALKFAQERNAYHLSIQEDFFDNFKISDTKTYTVKRGDTLTRILESNQLPLWLLRYVQEEGRLSSNLVVGQKISIPVITQKSEESGLILEEETDKEE